MQEQSVTNNPPEISLSEVADKIKKLIRYIRSKWLTLLIITVIGGVAGITYAWVQKPKYTAVVTFSLEDDKSSQGGGLAGIAAQFGLDLGSVGGAFSRENILSLIESNKMIQSTLLSTVSTDSGQKSLLNAYLDMNGMAKEFKTSSSKDLMGLSFPENQPLASFNRLQDSILILVTNNIRNNILKLSKPDSKLSMYQIECTSINEGFSTEFCKQLIIQVTEFYVETKTKRSAKIVDILQNRADSLKAAYDNALSGRAQLSDANINSAFQTPVVAIQRKQTDMTVLATAYGEVLKNLEVAKFNLLKDAPLIQVIDTPMQPLEKHKLGRLLSGVVGSIILALIYIIWLTFGFIFKPYLNKKVDK
jgi:hypothetical protein